MSETARINELIKGHGQLADDYVGPHRRYNACSGCLEDVITERDEAQAQAATLAEALRFWIDWVDGTDYDFSELEVEQHAAACTALAAYDKAKVPQ